MPSLRAEPVCRAVCRTCVPFLCAESVCQACVPSLCAGPRPPSVHVDPIHRQPKHEMLTCRPHRVPSPGFAATAAAAAGTAAVTTAITAAAAVAASFDPPPLSTQRRFEGAIQASKGQAFFLVFCTALSFATLALVLQIQFPAIGNYWFLLTLLSPYA